MKLIYVTENRPLIKQIYEPHIRRGYHKDSPLFVICVMVLLVFPVILLGTTYLVSTIIRAFLFDNPILEGLSILCFSTLFMTVISKKVMEDYPKETVFDNPYDTAINDYAWNTKGYTPKHQKAIFKILVQNLLLIAFTMVIVVLTASAWIHSHIQLGVLGFFISVLSILGTFKLCSDTTKRIRRLIKYGDSRLVFDIFPYPHYEPITIKWLAPQGLKKANAGEFTLRCLREDYYMVGKTERVRHLEMWRGTWELDEAYVFCADKIHNFHYELPRCSAMTELKSDKPTYWEFEVKLQTDSVDFEETYLVPIY